jgi:AcrR family transcriptional regulator
MGSQERRQRERAAARLLILDAARELFAEQGYDAVTMRKIAARIEYSPTAIYLHFADKRAVMRALCDTDFLALAGKFQRVAKIADPIARLRAAGRAYAAFALKHPNHYRLMFMNTHPEHGPHEGGAIERGNPKQDAYAFLKSIVAAALAAGRLRPALTDVDLVAQLVWSGMHGVVSLLIAKRCDAWVDWRSDRKIIDGALDLLVRGLVRAEAE